MARKSATSKPGVKKLSRSLRSHAPGHNLNITPFDRADFSAWAKASKLDPLEALAAQWLTDAAGLRRNNEADKAKLLEQHAKELKRAAYKFTK